MPVAVVVLFDLDDAIERTADQVRGGVADVVSNLEDAGADALATVGGGLVGPVRSAVRLALLVFDGVETFVDRVEGSGPVLVLGFGLANLLEGVRVVDRFEFIAQFVDGILAWVEVSHWWMVSSRG